MPQRYLEVVKKAKFLVQLSMPAAFRETKKEAMMSGVAKGLDNQLSMALMRNHSTGGAMNRMQAAKGGSP